MATSKHREETSPDASRKRLCTHGTDGSSSVDADRMDKSLTIARPDGTSDSLIQPGHGAQAGQDVLSLAELDRENQGPWEAEYSYEGETHLHQQYEKCVKNPGHQKFIPVDKFSIDHLPEGYRDKDHLDFIKLVSDLTVRVAVTYVSDKRPVIAPDIGKPYPGHSVRGRRRMTFGTGIVIFANASKLSPDDTCECKECRNSSTPETNFAKIHINTATHVVFDELEAEHTTCHLFFDRGRKPDACTGVVKLAGMSYVHNDISKDTCEIIHYTHDLELANKLEHMLEKLDSLGDTIFTKTPRYYKFKLNPTSMDKHPLICIVSHPHGCSKQISLGRWISADKWNNQIVSFYYTAATCPGSSGAHVFVMQDFTELDIPEPLSTEVHCGASVSQPGTNYCNTESEYPVFEMVTLDMLQMHTGPWEDNFCFVKEGDQNQNYAACKKNPGHGNFFPVEKLTKENLPPFYRSDELMECLKYASDLTVCFTVSYVSENRPATVPGTDMPYPWSSDKSSSIVRVGTGWIHGVEVTLEGEDDTCDCRECENSPSPQKNFAFIDIETAEHLVYDKLEADHTTCHLFFNSGETPDACKEVIKLNPVYDFQKRERKDTCALRYSTHDLDFAYRLQNALYSFENSLPPLNWAVTFINDIQRTDRMNYKPESLMCITISHAHGGAKHVSVGYNGSPGKAETDVRQSLHNSVICPGSSGARVFVLGRETIYPCCE